MAPRLAELCELLVEEKFGYPAGDVFTTLARHGRLALPQIQQHTHIPIKHLRPIILILITHNVLLWHQTDDSEHAYYQVDWHTAYVLVRQNKLVRLVEERQRHGKAARHLLQTILERGKVDVGSLEDEQYFGIASPRDSGIGMMDDQASDEGMANGNVSVNGLGFKTTDDQHITSVGLFHDILRSLLAEGWLSKATPRDHIPVAELEEQLRSEVVAADPKTFKDGKTTGPKTAVQFIHASNALKRKWQEEAEYSPQRDVVSHGTIKRGKSPTAGGNKRRKVDRNLTDGFHKFNDDHEDECDMAAAESSVRKLPSDMWLRVNHNKCLYELRTDRLELLADDYLGSTCASVYATLLQTAESKTPSVRSQLRVKAGFTIDDDDEATHDEDVTIADTEIVDLIERELDLTSTIKDTSGELDSKLSNGTAKNHKKRRFVPDEDEDVAGVGVKREVESDDEDGEPIINGVESQEQRQKRLIHIGMHLDLLGESSKKFLERNIDKRTSTINFSALSNMLAEAEIDEMILAHSGKIGLRIIRILREKGKLQDTQIAGMCLKRLKDLRAILTNLQFQGFIDVQELPRDNYRQPSRTTYLWYFNEQEVRQTFLQQTYQAMSNTLLRLAAEKDQHEDIIEKAESVGWDVKRLNKPERDLLARWQASEERLRTTVDRLDDVVMVLRDFDEADTSLLT